MAEVLLVLREDSLEVLSDKCSPDGYYVRTKSGNLDQPTLSGILQEFLELWAIFRELYWKSRKADHTDTNSDFEEDSAEMCRKPATARSLETGFEDLLEKGECVLREVGDCRPKGVRRFLLSDEEAERVICGLKEGIDALVMDVGGLTSSCAPKCSEKGLLRQEVSDDANNSDSENLDAILSEHVGSSYQSSEEGALMTDGDAPFVFVPIQKEE